MTIAANPALPEDKRLARLSKLCLALPGTTREDSIVEADRWMDRLDEKLSLWATQPMMGHTRDELSPGIRSLSFGRYVVFFEPLTDGIDVVRVLHGSRDIDITFEP